jgi:hypothetical protein
MGVAAFFFTLLVIVVYKFLVMCRRVNNVFVKRDIYII